ncbi:MAG: hypothetical protein JWQ44_329 [Chthoniobacter sp.]|jgi:hypothetical protein|nr:hypothetical protein [Chthoniobacter sp.]
MRLNLRTTLLMSAMLVAAPFARAKDQPLTLEQCPVPVQDVIRQYTAHGTLESVALDAKKKSGGPATYEAKFNLKDGKRIEVHISAEGKVLGFEDKKSKS